VSKPRVPDMPACAVVDLVTGGARATAVDGAPVARMKSGAS
jgi:hypothetical protein